jgi:hypothetical protein
VGKTTYEEVDRFFEHMGRVGYTRINDEGEIIHFDTSYGVKSAISLQIVVDFKSEIINEMRMYIGGLYEPGVSREDWSAYSLQSMLQAYGVPSKGGFNVQLPSEPPYTEGLIMYFFVLHFEEPNVTYFYVGEQISPGKYYRICPMSPDEYASYLWLFFGNHPYGDFSQFVDLTKATSLSLEEFYALFVEGDEGACMELDAKAFEVP